MNRTLLSFLVVMLLLSCSKTITPALQNVSPQLVIEGAVSDTAGPYYVSVTQTVDFYSPNNYPGVSGAQVVISDSTAGTVETLTEQSPGVYVTQSFPTGIPGHTYTLSVMLNGNAYHAVSTMPMPVALDSVTFDFSDTTQINAVANYQDPAGIANYYKYNSSVNGVMTNHFQAFEDRLSDGRYIRDNVDADTGVIKRSDLVELYLVGIDSLVFTYMKEAENVAFNNATLPAPANPGSNISGGCLGFFSAQTVSRKKAIARP